MKEAIVGAGSMTVDQAWDWYIRTRRLIGLFERLGRRYWDSLPDEGPIGRDRKFKELRATTIVEDANVSLDHLDDFAVLILYSAFESEVRGRVIAELGEHRGSLASGIVATLIDSTLKDLEVLSSMKLLDLWKDHVPETIRGTVSQVRDYRNWVAHGRRDKTPNSIEPVAAFDRLKEFLSHLPAFEYERGKPGPTGTDPAIPPPT